MLRLNASLLLAVCMGCSSPGPTGNTSMGHAWREQVRSESRPDGATAETEPVGEGGASQTVRPVPVATVNGRPIARDRLVDLTLRACGARVLEQLAVLELAEQLAAEQGITVTSADDDREYETSLRLLVDPLSSVTPERFDRDEAERVLAAVLARRSVSHEEFRLGVRLNACLRRIAESELTITEDQLADEFDRRYGRKARVRHIQLPTPGAAERSAERLTNGEEFSTVAARESANEASASVGGLLEPFSAGDEGVPVLMREVAFGLEPGEVSDPIRLGDWYHLVQLVEFIPPQPVDRDLIRDDLERGVKLRLAEPVMQDLYTAIWEQADLRIYDPVVRELFEGKRQQNE